MDIRTFLKIKFKNTFVRWTGTLREVYLDNSATTVVSEKSAQKVMELMTLKYGNPSSLHTKGLQAEKEIEYARRCVSERLGADAGEIFFTSGATEGNNLAVIGAAHRYKRSGRRIVTTLFEHSSVLEACKYLENQGFEVIYLNPGRHGVIDLNELQNAVDENTILVSVMHVNNETGAVQPVEKIHRIIKRKNSPAVFHCDAVQSFGKIPFKINKIKADLVTVTAHKIHGPKGVGAVYIKNGVRISPRQFGGEQQKKMRPGTEPAPLIAGFGAAVQEIDYNTAEKIMKLNTRLREGLKKIDGISINSTADSIPYIVNFSAEGIRSETMLHFLEERGIFVSSGSACAKGKKSHVLKAMGLSDRRIDSAVRVSFSKYNNEEDIDILLSALKEGINSLVKS